MTFLAATGDYGSPSGYPAYSPNVIAVGGTSLYVNTTIPTRAKPAGAWAAIPGTHARHRRRHQQLEAEPAYQEGVQNTGFRTNPDVSFVADPDTGATVYDSYNYGSAPGRITAAPAWPRRAGRA